MTARAMWILFFALLVGGIFVEEATKRSGGEREHAAALRASDASSPDDAWESRYAEQYSEALRRFTGPITGSAVRIVTKNGVRQEGVVLSISPDVIVLKVDGYPHTYTREWLSPESQRAVLACVYAETVASNMVRAEMARAKSTAMAETPSGYDDGGAGQVAPESRSDSFGGWKKWSDGKTWNSAPDSAKRDLCRRLASASRKGNSENYFYDALNSFYDSSDGEILNTSLDDAVRLMEAGSDALPDAMRRY